MTRLESIAYSFPIWLAATVVDERTLMPFASAFAVCGGVWWIGRKLQKQDDAIEILLDGQKQMKTQIENMPCRHCEIRLEKGQE